MGGQIMDAYPLQWPQGWPRTRAPKRSAFKYTGHVTTLALLNEIKLLGGKLAVISTNIRLRNDGLPYANDRVPDDKGAAVYFELKGHPMAFACDKWDKVHDNLQSIRKTIEALRGIERWGASDMMERAFSGFQQLTGPQMKSHCQILGVGENATPEQIRAQYQYLARRNHPDVGGDTNRMAEINEAYQALQKQGLA